MKTPSLLCLALLAAPLASAADAARLLSAQEVAGKLAATWNDGNSEIRLRMQIEGSGAATTLQLRIRQVRTAARSVVVYDVLWPKERKGETVFLRESGGSFQGTWLRADGTKQTLRAADALLGSDLAAADAVENFFAWKSQAIAGSEKIGNVECVILESKPSAASLYGRVRSWIDPRRMVPLRVEKYLPSGKLGRRIVTTRVVPDAGKSIPGDLRVESPGGASRTLLDGSRIRRDVAFADAELSPPK
jgi:hypothetical protein